MLHSKTRQALLAESRMKCDVIDYDIMEKPANPGCVCPLPIPWVMRMSPPRTQGWLLIECLMLTRGLSWGRAANPLFPAGFLLGQELPVLRDSENKTQRQLTP